MIRLLHGLDELFGTEWLRDVDDDEVRGNGVGIGTRLARRGFHFHRITGFAQPTFEQTKNLIVRFDNQDALLLLHATISDHQSVANV